MQQSGLCDRAGKYRFTMKAFVMLRKATNLAAPRKIAEWTFESCRISPNKSFILEEGYEHFLLAFSDNLLRSNHEQNSLKNSKNNTHWFPWKPILCTYHTQLPEAHTVFFLSSSVLILYYPSFLLLFPELFVIWPNEELWISVLTMPPRDCPLINTTLPLWFDRAKTYDSQWRIFKSYPFQGIPSRYAKRSLRR